ncbi:hypothetical protein [uncultured Parvimonas sp.]|uniref:hypothetical protein n=1 Tax=uncultured Parvimonas sp. TaxID=747372 RepID=UPI0028D75FC6|nr:hypothetical protein [uncultured Parvimonas sp.]
MNLFVYRKLNVVINVLIVVICILMLIFLNLNLFKKLKSDVNKEKKVSNKKKKGAK